MKITYVLPNGTGDTISHTFNKEWAKTKTEAEFVNEFKDMDHILPEAVNKVEMLKEAYQKITGGKPVVKAEPVKETPVSIVPKQEAPPAPNKPA